VSPQHEPAPFRFTLRFPVGYASPMPELALFRHGEELLRVAVGAVTRIGRSPDCEVCLPDPALSRLQAVIERRGEAHVLLDRSGRGTVVNGEAGAEATLSDGAELVLGTWRALFRARTAEPDAGETRLAGETRVREPGREEPSPVVRLRIRAGDAERTVALDGAAVVLGKDPGCEVPLEDPFVSGRHLRLEPGADRGRWRVVDLGSTNGTFVGGARVARAELPLGVTVRLGDTEVVIEAREPREAAGARAPFEGMLSTDPGMRQLFELVERVAASDAAVTILGETGTGKELVARALHARSPRAGGPFIPVNCSAIAETLIESELFGHEKGAFSGAERLRKGAFEEADQGTVFLDEIGELPLELQPKLLRVLELGEVKRVGASRPLSVSVRIVAATHRDLRAQVRAGKFREDLFYRLCVVPLTVPPLRARRGDVQLLAEAFLARAAPRGLALRWAEDALDRLLRYDWPGNVRQLRNVVQRALLFRGEGQLIGAEAITFEDTRSSTALVGGDDATLFLPGLTMEDVEREVIRLALRRHHGRRSAVVRELQIAKSTVIKRIAQWKLQGEGRSEETEEEDED
jgi:DNA-binding NtrC family response regulator/pSer/pThr/pTyr-binding forkhead associated (FHA) protein